MEANKKESLIGNLLLLLTAAIWGAAFPMQERAAAFVGPFTLNAIRSLIGSLVLFLYICLRSRVRKQPVLPGDRKGKKQLVAAGVLCGVFLCIAVNFQQAAIGLYPENVIASARGGFITALYVVLVPIFEIFRGKKPTIPVAVSVPVAVAGLWLLCSQNGLSGLYTGDLIMLCCALAFTFQILCISSFGDRVDGVSLSCVQFLVCGLLSLIPTLIFEHPSPAQLSGAAPSFLYLGVMSCAVAYTLQIVGQQKSRNPTAASLIMSLESVFAALFGVLFAVLGHKSASLSLREIAGCLVMFSAIVLSQLPVGRSDKKAK